MCRMISVRCDGARLLTDIAGDLRERFDFAVFWFHEKCELDPNSLMDRPSSFSPTMRPEPSRFWKLYATPLMQFPTPSIGREISCKASDASRREVANVCLASLRANGSRECAPDDRLREAIHGRNKKRWIASSLRSSQ